MSTRVFLCAEDIIRFLGGGVCTGKFVKNAACNRLSMKYSTKLCGLLNFTRQDFQLL